MPLQDQRQSGQQVLTVSALARQARILIEENFAVVQVEGELSNFRKPGSGHWYFTLKDNAAQIRCAMFAGRNRRTRITPRDGQQVLARGKLSLYEARGDFQLIVDDLQPAGEGALRAAFEALKLKLDAEGLFADSRKRQLPALPRHLSIVSSASGAALRDVLNVISRRFPALDVTLIPTLVQGEQAEQQVLRALRLASERETDVVLITRGGGSLEDLQVFNLESVARAVAACPHPVVSAIGHQTDFSIVDFVADVRAPTPSAGAELITPAAEDLARMLTDLDTRARRSQHHEMRFLGQSLALLRARLIDPRQHLRQRMMQADDLEGRLLRALARKLRDEEGRLHIAAQRLSLLQPARALPAMTAALIRTHGSLLVALRATLERRTLALAGTVRALEAVSPENTLARGYAVLACAPEDGAIRPITSIASVQAGDNLTAYLADGALDVSVSGVVRERLLTSRVSPQRRPDDGR